MSDPADLLRQLEAMKPIDVTLTPAALFAIVGLMQIAGELPNNPISRTAAARLTLRQLRHYLPEGLRQIADGAARETRDKLRRPIAERVFAAAQAAGENPN